jgi:hypothetical protein
MAQYYFKTSGGFSDMTTDPLEYGNIDEVRRAAVASLGEMLRYDPDSVWQNELQVQVARDDGLILFTLIVVGIESPAAVAAKH